MKKIINFIAGFAAVAALFACSSQYEDNKTWSFVVIDANEIEIPEGPYVAGADTTIFIPVWLHNCKSGSTVSYTVTDNTATVGTDYTLVDNSGVLNFGEGVDSLAIGIKITGQAGVFTKNVDFTIALASATNDVVIASTDKCKITIKDLDHPLAAILGDYGITGVFLYYSNGNVYNFSAVSFASITLTPDEKDVSKVWFSDIGPAFYLFNMGKSSPFYGIVSEDMKTIKVPYGQGIVILEEYPVELAPAVLDTTVGDVVAGDFKEGDAIVFTLDETASGKVYVSTDSWDIFDVDPKSGEMDATSYYTPVLGSAFNPAFKTVITKL